MTLSARSYHFRHSTAAVARYGMPGRGISLPMLAMIALETLTCVGKFWTLFSYSCNSL